MTTLGSLSQLVDAELARATFTRTSGEHDFIARAYHTTLDGMPLRASLSVFVDTGAPNRAPSGRATGYELAIECENGLATRWIVGDVPVLLGIGLTRVGDVIPGAPLLADDAAWASSRLLGAAREPLASLVGSCSFVEQRPGILQTKLLRHQNTELPDIARWLDAFASLARASAIAPAPRVAEARITDRRGLMVVLLGLFVVGVFFGCGMLYWMLVR